MGDQWKRYRAEPPDAAFVLRKAREIWKWDTEKKRATATKDEDFSEFFGCGVIVFLSLWNLLERFDLIPPGGEVYHLLWTLMCFKVYAKQNVLCALAGGIDGNTYMKWVWLFTDNILVLESNLVSTLTA